MQTGQNNDNNEEQTKENSSDPIGEDQVKVMSKYLDTSMTNSDINSPQKNQTPTKQHDKNFSNDYLTPSGSSNLKQMSSNEKNHEINNNLNFESRNAQKEIYLTENNKNQDKTSDVIDSSNEEEMQKETASIKTSYPQHNENEISEAERQPSTELAEQKLLPFKNDLHDSRIQLSRHPTELMRSFPQKEEKKMRSILSDIHDTRVKDMLQLKKSNKSVLDIPTTTELILHKMVPLKDNLSDSRIQPIQINLWTINALELMRSFDKKEKNNDKHNEKEYSGANNSIEIQACTELAEQKLVPFKNDLHDTRIQSFKSSINPTELMRSFAQKEEEKMRSILSDINDTRVKDLPQMKFQDISILKKSNQSVDVLTSKELTLHNLVHLKGDLYDSRIQPIQINLWTRNALELMRRFDNKEKNKKRSLQSDDSDIRVKDLLQMKFPEISILKEETRTNSNVEKQSGMELTERKIVLFKVDSSDSRVQPITRSSVPKEKNEMTHIQTELREPKIIFFNDNSSDSRIQPNKISIEAPDLMRSFEQPKTNTIVETTEFIEEKRIIFKNDSPDSRIQPSQINFWTMNALELMKKEKEKIKILPSEDSCDTRVKVLPQMKNFLKLGSLFKESQSQFIKKKIKTAGRILIERFLDNKKKYFIRWRALKYPSLHNLFLIYLKYHICGKRQIFHTWKINTLFCAQIHNRSLKNDTLKRQIKYFECDAVDKRIVYHQNVCILLSELCQTLSKQISIIKDDISDKPIYKPSRIEMNFNILKKKLQEAISIPLLKQLRNDKSDTICEISTHPTKISLADVDFHFSKQSIPIFKKITADLSDERRIPLNFVNKYFFNEIDLKFRSSSKLHKQIVSESVDKRIPNLNYMHPIPLEKTYSKVEDNKNLRKTAPKLFFSHKRDDAQRKNKTTNTCNVNAIDEQSNRVPKWKTLNSENSDRRVQQCLGYSTVIHIYNQFHKQKEIIKHIQNDECDRRVARILKKLQVDDIVNLITKKSRCIRNNCSDQRIQQYISPPLHCASIETKKKNKFTKRITNDHIDKRLESFHTFLAFCFVDILSRQRSLESECPDKRIHWLNNFKYPVEHILALERTKCSVKYILNHAGEQRTCKYCVSDISQKMNQIDKKFNTKSLFNTQKDLALIPNKSFKLTLDIIEDNYRNFKLKSKIHSHTPKNFSLPDKCFQDFSNNLEPLSASITKRIKLYQPQCSSISLILKPISFSLRTSNDKIIRRDIKPKNQTTFHLNYTPRNKLIAGLPTFSLQSDGISLMRSNLQMTLKSSPIELIKNMIKCRSINPDETFDTKLKIATTARHSALMRAIGDISSFFHKYKIFQDELREIGMINIKKEYEKLYYEVVAEFNSAKMRKIIEIFFRYFLILYKRIIAYHLSLFKTGEKIVSMEIYLQFLRKCIKDLNAIQNTLPNAIEGLNRDITRSIQIIKQYHQLQENKSEILTRFSHTGNLFSLKLQNIIHSSSLIEKSQCELWNSPQDNVKKRICFDERTTSGAKNLHVSIFNNEPIINIEKTMTFANMHDEERKNDIDEKKEIHRLELLKHMLVNKTQDLVGNFEQLQRKSKEKTNILLKTQMNFRYRYIFLFLTVLLWFAIVILVLANFQKYFLK